MKKEFKEIDNKDVKEVVSLTKKILNLLYIVMIVAIVLCGTIILKNLKLWDFIITFLKILSPLFVGFVIAWLFNPIVKKLNQKGILRIMGSTLVYAVFLLFISAMFLSITSALTDVKMEIIAMSTHIFLLSCRFPMRYPEIMVESLYE